MAGVKSATGLIECDHAVFLKDCHLNQQGSSAENLTGSSANEIFRNLSSCNTRVINELVLGETFHKWQLVQLTIDDYRHYCVYKMPS